MRRWARALTTLLAAAVAGLLLWFAPHFHRWTTSGYWGVIGLMVIAGVLVGLSQLHARDGNPLASFLAAFVPVLVAAGWVILADEPRGSWVRDHVLSWSGDMGIGHAVHNLGEHVAVLAFGLGIVFGALFEPRMLRRASTAILPQAAAVSAASSTRSAPLDVAQQAPTTVEPGGAEQPTELTARPPQEQATPEEPAQDEPTVVASPDERRRPDAEPAGAPSEPAELGADESTVVAQPGAIEPAPLPPLPKRFTQGWFVDNAPLLDSDQVPVLLAELRRRGWSEGEIEQRAIPYLKPDDEADGVPSGGGG